MCLHIDLIKNKPIDSNCYLIYSESSNTCIIVDPGTDKCEGLLSVLEFKKLCVEYVILTHEHFDHVWGCDFLKNKFGCKIICSETCANNIATSKRNLSLFYNQVGFGISHVDVVLEGINWQFFWNGVLIHFFKALGHSEGSICFHIGNNLFVGDTLIKGMKTVTKLVGGNKKDLVNTLNLIFKEYEAMLIYPGHGEPFYLRDTSIEDFCGLINNDEHEI